MEQLQDIKDEYYKQVALGIQTRISMKEYIKENYVQTYDDELNLIGYTKEQRT